LAGGGRAGNASVIGCHRWATAPVFARNVNDFSIFAGRLDGRDGTYPSDCDDAEFDGDVDIHDFAVFQRESGEVGACYHL
jgi:hypothetical protein